MVAIHAGNDDHARPGNPLASRSRAVLALHARWRHFPDGDADRSRALENARVPWAVVEDRFPRFDGELAPLLVDDRIARDAFVTSWLENDKDVDVTIPGAARVVAKSIACESVAPGFTTGDFRWAPEYPGNCASTASFKTCTETFSGNQLYDDRLYGNRSFTRIPSCINMNANARVNLKGLVLSGTNVSKIENIENIINLELLDARGTNISKIEGLDQNVNLKELILSSTPVSKIENLEKNVNLHTISLLDTRVTKIEGLDTLVNLRDLGISGTPVPDAERQAFKKQRPSVNVW